MSGEMTQAKLHVHLPSGRLDMPLMGRTSIGSAPECTLSLQEDGLEAYHCVIQPTDEGGWELVDLTFGGATHLNGRSEGGGILKSGDQLRLGELRLTFLHPRAAATPLPAGAESSPGAQADEVLPLAPPAATPAAAGAPAPADEEAGPTDAPEASAARKGWWSRVLGRERADATSPAGSATEAAAVAVAPPAAAPAAALPPKIETYHWQDAAAEGLQRSTAWTASLLIHALALFLMSLMTTETKIERPPPPPLVADMGPAPESLEQLEDEFEEVPPEVEPEAEEMEAPDAIEPEVAISDDEAFGEEGEDEPAAEPLPGVFEGGGALDLDGSGGGRLAARLGEGNLGRYARSLRASGLDIVFVLDSTGSMGPVLEAASEQIAEMIHFLQVLVPGTRLGIVAYRDEGDEYLTRTVDLSDAGYRAVAFLDGLEADGGGDLPESVWAGVNAAVKEAGWHKKATKMVVVVGDARGHSREQARLRSIVSRFILQKGTVHCLYTPAGGGRGGDSETAEFFRELARGGKGGFARLEARDEVLKRILQVALGRGNESEVAAKIEELRNGVRGAAARRLVSRRDVRRLARHLRRGRPDATLLRDLASQNGRWLVPVWLAVLADPDAPEANRWAACVLLRRLLPSLRAGREARIVARSIGPDRAEATANEALARLAELLAAAGVRTRLPESKR